MPDRLSRQDVAFLTQETPATPQHGGSVLVLEPPEGGFDHARLVALIEARIALVPRYRQRVRRVPGGLANPVWGDDPDVDIDFHVRRSALPRPGSRAQLDELVARLQSRPLDRSRPLWEVYLVEGLEGGRVALITKTHHAMVDGVAAVDLATVLLDARPEERSPAPDDWPRSAPGPAALVAGAVVDLVRHPVTAVDAWRTAAEETRAVTDRLSGGLLTAARTLARPTRESPLLTRTGQQRRYATATTSLADHRAVRAAYGGTVNDVVLATVAGALRAWLMTRGEPVGPHTTVRTVVPLSVRGEPGAPGNRVSSYFVDLPVGEASPVVRLHQVSFAMRGHAESGRSVEAGTLVGQSGFSPPTLHSLGARVVSSLSRRSFSLVVTNVPGPQFPVYAAGARVLQVHPVVPLVAGQAVSVGVTSYDGGVYYGLNADRDAMPDVDVLAGCLEEAVEELAGRRRGDA